MINFKQFMNGDRITFGNLDYIKQNIEGNIHNDTRSPSVIKADVYNNTPAGFNSNMLFMAGESGTVQYTSIYTGHIESKYIRNNFNRDSIQIIKVIFDNPLVNKKSRHYTLTTPMFVLSSNTLLNLENKDHFIQNLGCLNQEYTEFNKGVICEI
jgi:hypothetical protein